MDYQTDDDLPGAVPDTDILSTCACSRGQPACQITAFECELPSDESFNYIADIDRGGLTWPTDLLLNIVVQSIIAFKCLVSQKHATHFNLAENQRAITSGVALQRCLSVLDISGKCSGCGVSMTDTATLCIRTVCNIALNNYTKNLTDGQTKSKTLRKLSTLTK